MVIQPRMVLASTTDRTWCWLTSNLLPASTSGDSTTELLPPACQFPACNPVRGSSFPHAQLCLFSSWKFTVVLSAHSSTLDRSLWMAALLQTFWSHYLDVFCKLYKSALYCLLQVIDKILQYSTCYEHPGGVWPINHYPKPDHPVQPF